MSTFATEFAVSAEIDQAGFTAEVIAWLRGMEGSEILSASTDKDLDADTPVLKAETGEELRMLVLSGETGMEAIGFCHRLPDEEGPSGKARGSGAGPTRAMPSCGCRHNVLQRPPLPICRLHESPISSRPS